MSEGSGFRRHLAVLLFCLPFGVFVGEVLASAPAESIDLKQAGRVVLAQAQRIINRWNSVTPPTPTAGTARRGFRSPWLNESEYGNSVTREPAAVDAKSSYFGAQHIEGAQSALKGGTMNMLLSGLPEVPGRIDAKYGVSFNGSATYSIPLWTPSGARGIEPKLSLNYASSAGDTWMGKGWMLEGLSAISRCPRTTGQDGVAQRVTLTLADRFCLDGYQLRLTSGTYGVASSTYQTELDTFSRVTALGASGNGPERFEVYGKDGLIYEYGNTLDSRIFGTGGTTPYLWALNKVRDRQGNNMVFAYVQSNGAYRPSTISYTQIPSTGVGYNYVVTFNYTARSTVANSNQYVDDDKVQQTQVLTSVVMTSGGTTVRQYTLDYATSPTTLLPRLTAIQECSASDCLRPTTVTYQDGAAGVGATYVSTGTSGFNTFRMLDMNGDGGWIWSWKRRA